MARRPLSLQARSLLAAGVVLVAFLGMTGVALDQAIYQTLRNTLHDRLQGYAEAYIAKSDVSRARRWLPPEVDPEPFLSPDSGLYAAMAGPVEVDGVRRDNWRSQSAYAVADLPQFDATLKPGATEFTTTPIDGAGGKVYLYSYGLSWPVAGKDPVLTTIHIAEDAKHLEVQRNVFRRSLVFTFGGLAVGLLLLLLGVVRWILQPARQIAIELGRVERGEQEQLSTDYPLELKRLAGSINDFIDSERNSLKRYRNTLSDLAHSLKTPLAVVRSQLESGADGKEFRWTVLEQVGRMDSIVAYQLSRAATSGHSTFAAPILIEPHAEEIVSGLEKVYAAKKILCEFDVDPKAQFYGEEGDLLELLGNLLENAFKWTSHRVLLTARVIPGVPGARRNGLIFMVEDDGPGIPADKVEHLLQRGVRGDERVQGHGIGLAIVQDLLKAYRGNLTVSKSENLGGAAFTVRFAPG
ncbi:MAG: GHKL domain-containing protein [Proteobacteria bacterium]|uniref:ATP-binding protein n=1 Tax=Rudaea sp. TaxID=2136325 RepID=UPI0032202278|nr:GHKL domain-containing protein [Pseudomonadota bacterium]